MKKLIEIAQSRVAIGSNGFGSKSREQFDVGQALKGIFSKKVAEQLANDIQMKIKEKFKDRRQAFRTFDKSLVGKISLSEFMSGLESIGILLKIDEYQKIF